MFQEHVDALSIGDLRLALKSAGLQNGPITSSTETVYRAALNKYLNSKSEPSSNATSDVECVDSASGSDGEAQFELNGASEFSREQSPSVSREIARTKFTPIRWNQNLQRYESVYDENDCSQTTYKRDENQANKGVRNWLPLLAVAVVFLAIVIAFIFLSGDRDLYKGLEDAANRIANHPENLAVEQ